MKKEEFLRAEYLKSKGLKGQSLNQEEKDLLLKLNKNDFDNLLNKIKRYCNYSYSRYGTVYNIIIFYQNGKLNINVHGGNDNMNFAVQCDDLSHIFDILNIDGANYYGLRTIEYDEAKVLVKSANRNNVDFCSDIKVLVNIPIEENNQAFSITYVLPKEILEAKLNERKNIDITTNKVSIQTKKYSDTKSLFKDIIRFIETKAARKGSFYTIDINYFEGNLIVKIHSNINRETNDECSDEVNLSVECSKAIAKYEVGRMIYDFIHRHNDYIVAQGIDEFGTQTFVNRYFELNIRDFAREDLQRELVLNNNKVKTLK